MRITNRGVQIDEIGAEGVYSITADDGQAVTISFGWETEALTWNKDEARNVALALLAAIGEDAPKAEAAVLIDGEGDEWIKQLGGRYYLPRTGSFRTRSEIERLYGIKSEGIDVTEGRPADR